MNLRLSLCLPLLLGAFSMDAMAATTVNLPTWLCNNSGTLFRSGFQTGELVPHDPSLGSGGTVGGATSRTLHIAGLGNGTQTYYVYVPSSYNSGRPTPLVLALHGTAPWADRDTYASDVRDKWANAANAYGFLVAAPVADDQVSTGSGLAASWSLPPTAGPNDYDLFDAIRADMESAYNVERTRLYGWGFSSGGHVMYDLVFGGYSPSWSFDTMAAFSVSAGTLSALACAGLDDAGCNALVAAAGRPLPLDIHEGINDPTVPKSYTRADHTRFLGQGWTDSSTIFYTEFTDGLPSGGHTYSSGHMLNIASHFCPFAVTP